MKLEKRITFFYTNYTEKQVIEPIAHDAVKRGYEVIYTNNIHEDAIIGFYCQHKGDPRNSKFSVVLLHDMAQGHNSWPDFWVNEPWDKFDIGIIPGDSWEKRWRQCLWNPNAKPRKGVYKLGWPKADLAFENRKEFEAEVQELKSNLKLKYEKSILYAPSWENDGKQDDFVKSLYEFPVNLLIKQAKVTDDDFPEMKRNIDNMNKLHRNFSDNIYILDPEINIMHCLALADAVVSDESSVMIEALLFEVPSITIMDWLIPDCTPPRFVSVPMDFPLKIKKSELKNTVKSILDAPAVYKSNLKQHKERHFVNLGECSRLIMDMIDGYVTGNKKIRPLNVNIVFLFGHVLIRFTRKIRGWLKSIRKDIFPYFTIIKYSAEFPEVVDHIYDLFNNPRILIYTGSTHTNKLLTIVKRKELRKNIIGIVDSDCNKWGKKIKGISIYPIEQIKELNPSRILISSQTYEKEIYERIKHLEKNGIEIKKIYDGNPIGNLVSLLIKQV